jgi:hypothetical protein
MTKLWAIYRTADNGAKQVLVLTQFADTVRDMIDDSEDSAEWDSDADRGGASRIDIDCEISQKS